MDFETFARILAARERQSQREFAVTRSRDARRGDRGIENAREARGQSERVSRDDVFRMLQLRAGPV